MQQDPQTFRFQDDGRIPNSGLSLVLYRGAVPPDAAATEQRFAANGWSNSWRDGIFPYHHFHSIAHEVLGVAAGEATVLFGGPDGEAVRIGPGDVVVIPAGVGHCNQGSSADFLVVGAYPPQGTYDLCRGSAAEHAKALATIPQVPLPKTDPVLGADGPLVKLWAG